MSENRVPSIQKLKGLIVATANYLRAVTEADGRAIVSVRPVIALESLYQELEHFKLPMICKGWPDVLRVSDGIDLIRTHGNGLVDLYGQQAWREGKPAWNVYDRREGLPKVEQSVLDDMASAVLWLHEETVAIKLAEDISEERGKGKPGKRGRKPKTKPDKIDLVIRKMLDNGDVERHGRKWGELLHLYADQLPKNMSANALRKRVEREEARRRAVNN